ncbi:MAG TPA: phage tail protein, partial [Rhodocyclaceae bacterium]
MASLSDVLKGNVGTVIKNAVFTTAVGALRRVLPQVSAMAALGLFVFSLHTLPYQQLQRSAQWRHPSNSRVGRRPARQYVGPGDETITLTGTLYPEITGGAVSLALVRAMADMGKAWPLIQ